MIEVMNISNKKILKDSLARDLISKGEEDFPGEQNIAYNIFHADSEDTIVISVNLYAIAVKKFLEKGKLKQALDWLDYVLFFREDYYQVYFRKAEIYRLRNTHKEAVQYCTDGIDIYNKNKDSTKDIYALAWGYLERAINYIKLAEYKKAYKDLLIVKGEMIETKSAYSVGLSCAEVYRLVSLSFLAQSDKKAAEKLHKMIARWEKNEKRGQENF